MSADTHQATDVPEPPRIIGAGRTHRLVAAVIDLIVAWSFLIWAERKRWFVLAYAGCAAYLLFRDCLFGKSLGKLLTGLRVVNWPDCGVLKIDRILRRAYYFFGPLALIAVFAVVVGAFIDQQQIEGPVRDGLAMMIVAMTFAWIGKCLTISESRTRRNHYDVWSKAVVATDRACSRITRERQADATLANKAQQADT